LGYDKLLAMEPKELITWLDDNFNGVVMSDIQTLDELDAAKCMLSMLTNQYSYLASMTLFAKVAVRAEKRKGKEFKEQAEDMIDRRDAIEDMAKIVLQQYNTVSRMITVKMEVNKELGMNMG